MEPKINKYPVFETNQVLLESHLNQLFDYLDENERLTRANLIGIGIACGLEITFDETSGDGPVINIYKGCGVTSEGYLITEPENVKLKFYRDYKLPDKCAYPLLKNNTSNLWELLPDNGSGGKSLEELSEEMNNKAVVLLLELKKNDLRNCSPNNCNDKGSEKTATLRHLLINTEELNKIIKEANELESATPADIENALFPLIELPDLRLHRYNVPELGAASTPEVLAGFFTAINAGKFEAVEDALNKTYEAFKPLLEDIYPDNPFDDFSAKFGFLNKDKMAEEEKKQVSFLQYYYDFFDDLLNAYNEFREKGEKLLCKCCPSGSLFPQHLMVGALKPDSVSNPALYRNTFTPSPAVGGCEERVKEVKFLFRRMVEMIRSFTNRLLLANPADEIRITPGRLGDAPISEKALVDEIRITPSKLGDIPISEKAIPYYYSQDRNPPLYELWNFGKTGRNRANHNLSYHFRKYGEDAPEFIKDALNYDLEPYNFLRVEGHLGRNIQEVFKDLLKLKFDHNLPIELAALCAGGDKNELMDKTSAGLLSRFLSEHPGIQHKAGVPLGGTFILVYHGLLPHKADRELNFGTVIADFFLPYRIEPSEMTDYILIRECEYEWIDSIKHLNNLTLRDYRYTATRKAPAANEFERNRLKDNYIIRIYKYTIQGESLLPGNKAVDIVIPLKELKKLKLSAVAKALNNEFPLGVVFDSQPNSNKILIRRLEGQHFRIELGGVQGNQIRYAFENDSIYRWQKNIWENLSHTSGIKVVCRTLGPVYREEDYRRLHQRHKPQYPAPGSASLPAAEDAIEWEKMTLVRACKYSTLKLLPPSVQSAVQTIVKEIKLIDNDAKIVLVGSWANGSWVPFDEWVLYQSLKEEDKDKGKWKKFKEFLQLRKKATGKTGPSDIVLLIDSQYEITPEMINVTTAYKISFIKGKKDAQKGIAL